MNKLLATITLAIIPWFGAQAQVISSQQALPQGITTATQALIQKAGDTRSAIKFQADCAAGIAVDSCVAAPTPRGCPVGTNWSLEGSGIAHCVVSSVVCATGTTQTKDAYGNLSCVAVAVTTPIPVAADPVVIEPAPAACVPQKFIVSEVPCNNGAPGNHVAYYMACTKSTERFPVGDYVDNSACVIKAPTPAICSASDTVETGYCAGSTATTSFHTVVSCPGSVVSTYTTGTCPATTCANGASDFPTCTPLAAGAVPGDVNGDGKVDCLDLTIVKNSLGKKPGDAGYDARADIYVDGVVNTKDYTWVSKFKPAGLVCK